MFKHRNHKYKRCERYVCNVYCKRKHLLSSMHTVLQKVYVQDSLQCEYLQLRNMTPMRHTGTFAEVRAELLLYLIYTYGVQQKEYKEFPMKERQLDIFIL